MTLLSLLCPEVFVAAILGFWLRKIPKSWMARLAVAGMVGIVIYVVHVAIVVVYWRLPTNSETAAVGQAANDGASIIANIMFVGPFFGLLSGLACLLMLHVKIGKRISMVSTSAGASIRPPSPPSTNPYDPPR